MGTRRKSRELVLQMLFQADMGRQSPDDVRRIFWKERSSVDAEARGFAEDLFRVATDRTEEVDKLIEGHAEHWRMDRMAAVDRNILRAAVAELLGFPATPRAVIINEALESRVSFPAPNRCSSLMACWTVWGGNWKCRAERDPQTAWRCRKAAGPTTLLHGFTAIKSGSHAVVVAVPVPL